MENVFTKENTEEFDAEELNALNRAFEIVWAKTENKSKSNRDYVAEQILGEAEYNIRLMQRRN
ncbi:MAG: hypothetical protein PHD63_06510 [Candidatus Marinimicrobia bacterium]|nr:hypothetical protein [Candidatus Neomarinimicrobiota bacterium]